MGAVNSGIDDGDGYTGAIVTSFFPSHVNAVQNSCIPVLNGENAVKFNHDDSWNVEGLANQINVNAASQRINVCQFPLVHITNFPFQQCDFVSGWRVVKVNDQRQSVVFIKENRIVFVKFHHVSDGVLVLVDRGLNPPSFFNGRFSFNLDGGGQGQSWKQHQR